MTSMNFEDIGRFIYGAARYGGDLVDVMDWMADDVGAARLAPGNDDAMRDLFSTFFAKYQDNDALRENYERFIDVLKNRLLGR